LVSPEPSDLKSTRRIRLDLDRVRIVRSRSDGPDPEIPLRPGCFVKEPLDFFKINPWSTAVQK